jgi:predicted nuclease with TOPRIM domain
MPNIQEVFNRIEERKRETRSIKLLYRDALESSGEYREILKKLEQLRARKKQLEGSAWEEVGSRDKFETTKLHIKEDREMLSDLALSTLMRGETVEVVDQDNNQYEPLFSVRFKKANVISK